MAAECGATGEVCGVLRGGLPRVRGVGSEVALISGGGARLFGDVNKMVRPFLFFVIASPLLLPPFVRDVVGLVGPLAIGCPGCEGSDGYLEWCW